ncbi:hypothetical protein EW026_g8455 [Hermanssonia centrifuga]|uniref:DDE Tnp4 domain-containing protein n=1 Tax=Hermanssonia centrifuga TaxID=98765 RepID=A0A4S4K408_9APHY|nr:hypothetical protein EW026_g8455 [Hermanssonia centrifuga]
MIDIVSSMQNKITFVLSRIALHLLLMEAESAVIPPTKQLKPDILNEVRHDFNFIINFKALQDAHEQEFEVDAEGNVVGEDKNQEACPDKPLGGNRRIRAQFGRKRTHNEQIIVAPCGVIIARATFYGAEAIHSVAEFIKRTYYADYRPDHIFFDNNCCLKLSVKDDPFFKNIGLTVDVFHFKCKHSTKDLFCQQNCNPAAYPELMRNDGGWYFNSSIAEQTNVWIAGYNAIC